MEPCNGLSKLCGELGQCCTSIGKALDELFRPCYLAIGAGCAACCLALTSFFDTERPFVCCRLITVMSILLGAILAVLSFASPDSTCATSPPHWLLIQLVFMAFNLLYAFYFFKKVNYSAVDNGTQFHERLYKTVMVDPASACMIIVEIAAFIWSIMGLDLLYSDCAAARYSGWIALISTVMIQFVVLYIISCMCGVYCANDKCLSILCCPFAMIGQRMMDEADRAETRDRFAIQEREMEEQRIQRERNVDTSANPRTPATLATTPVLPPAYRWIPPSLPYDPRSPKLERNSEQAHEQPPVQSQTDEKGEKKKAGDWRHVKAKEKAVEPPTLTGIMFKMASKVVFSKENYKAAKNERVARV